MNTRIKAAFLLMLLLQAVHSAEEIIFRFHEAFRPMRFIYRLHPDLARPAFIGFNSLLILFGLFCFFYWVLPAREGARWVLWLWVGIQLTTIVAHAVWFITTGGYHPGLVTVPLLLPAALYMLYQLRRLTSARMPGDRREPAP